MGKNNKQLTTEEFIERAKKVHGEKYSYEKVEYKNNYTTIIIICPKHGEFKSKPRAHLNGHKCVKCINDDRINNFIKKAASVHGNKYNYSKVKYKDYYSKVTIACPEHGEFRQTFNSHTQGSGCYKCQHNSILDTKQFIERAKETHSNKYNYSNTNYKNSRTKVIIICNKHGKFEQFPRSHIRGDGCPNCHESKGEKLIEKFLINNHINHIRQAKFIDCVGKRNKLSFDFFLPDYNMCIEYDGEHHFIPSFYSKHDNIKQFEIIKFRDYIKDKYCVDHNITLIRIHYKFKDQISSILSKSISTQKGAAI